MQQQWWSTPPSVAAQLLNPLAHGYEALADAAARRARPQSVSAPVIVVGNYVVGGAGKTPTTIALVRALQARGWHPGVVSRGHGRKADGVEPVTPTATPSLVGDEPLLIARRSGAPVMVARSRVDAARALLAQHGDVDVIVADDGLQHHALARQAQVIVIDERGFGNGLLLPAGPLRQRPPADVPPHSVVLYNAPAPTTPWPGSLARRGLQGAVSLIDWHAGAHADDESLQRLRGRSLAAAAGVAVPERFFSMLEGCGLRIDRFALPDHFDWHTWPSSLQDRDVIVTEKDAVKMSPQHRSAARVWVAPLDFAIPENVIDSLLAWLAPRRLDNITTDP